MHFFGACKIALALSWCARLQFSFVNICVKMEILCIGVAHFMLVFRVLKFYLF